jgi:hypothetical protein
MLDVVFADGPGAQAGFYDNNGGLDYHIPIEGGTGTMPGLKVSSSVRPFVGGGEQCSCRGLLDTQADQETSSAGC